MWYFPQIGVPKYEPLFRYMFGGSNGITENKMETTIMGLYRVYRTITLTIRTPPNILIILGHPRVMPQQTTNAMASLRLSGA